MLVRLILRGAIALIVCGLLIGLPLAFAAARFLGTQLFGMSPYNPVVMLGAVLALGLSTLIASLIPALRASWISPRMPCAPSNAYRAVEWPVVHSHICRSI